MCTVFGIGYGPLSDSSAYSNETRERGVFLETTSNGIPIGPPSQRPEPKSGCKPVVSPIDWISCAEFAATGSVSTRSFHGFVAGNIGHFGADGTLSACAVEPPRSIAPAASAIRRFMGASCPSPRRVESPYGVDGIETVT